MPLSYEACTNSAPLSAEALIRDNPVILDGVHLSIDDVARVAYQGVKVRLTDDESVLRRVRASRDYVLKAVEANQPIYGVTTLFGGMANTAVPQGAAPALQNNLLWAHKTGAGKRLPVADVRAGILLRMHSLLQGASGVRLGIIRRLETFLNAGVTPHVYEFGSIGASGDLVPLAYIAGSLVGLDSRYRVDVNGDETDAVTALRRLGLERIDLEPKEGLALINGTSMMAGIAANCVHRARDFLALALGAHALAFQGLYATNQSLHPFIHQLKPHPGQVWTAARMLDLLAGSRLIRDELDGQHGHRPQDLIQDRYSLRCLPQYLGPIVDGIDHIAAQIEVECNSATDNPLIDGEAQVSYHGGNFLGQYVAVAMDQLRYYLGLIAKHLDVQIALLVAPEFNRGLSASLVGNTAQTINLGLKGLQLTGNAIMPLLSFYGTSFADRFPTHAEQFNQNINSQGFGSAQLTRQALDTFQPYMAIALMFGIQAVDLRTLVVAGHYDARACLSSGTVALYEALRRVIGTPASKDRPYIWDDNEQFLDVHIDKIVNDIEKCGEITTSVHALRRRGGAS